MANWIEGQYNTHRINLSIGPIYVFWNEGGYSATVVDRKLTHKFTNLDLAKKSAVGAARKLLKESLLQLPRED